MAMRQAVQALDGVISERRLRPIYDWLDIGKNKKALQEAEKVLKKSPSLQSATALKALSLLRLGKTAEAHALLEALAEECPSDDNTLQAMTISYRESQQLHKVCTLYESAVKVEPNNEELYSHLFMSYVRVGNHMAQQRVAMALYKFAPKNPYYFWAVMSIVLQAKHTDDSAKKGILLTLAHRMVDKFIKDNKIEAEQETRIYIIILELQEKWEDIIKFMEGPLYAKLVPGSMPQAMIPYLKHLRQWRRLNVITKELLWQNQDRWDYYVLYFDSMFELMKMTHNDMNGDTGADDTPEKCHEFICQLVESMSSKKVLRGPYLARLELWKRLSKEGDATSLLGSPAALCIEYLREFAHKPCALPDLRPYISMIPQDEREEHSRNFLTCLGFDELSQPSNTKSIQSHISCLGMWRMTASPFDAAGCLAFANTLRAHYLTSLHTGLVTSTATEFCAADAYAIFAAHHYFYAAVLEESSAPIVEAIYLLELVYHKSQANFHVKLLLVALYHVLGNAFAADTIYQRLEIKYVQLLSMGWLHAARLPPCCAHTRALQLLADTKAFHNHHAKDSLEHLTYSYKHGTFDKLVELIDWNSRMERCVWSAISAREMALLSLLAGPAGPLYAPPKLPEKPCDNRDLNVILNWEPPHCINPNFKTISMEQDVAYLRLKDGLVSAIALCIELTDDKTIEEKTQLYDALVLCTDSLSNALDKCKEKYSEKEKISLTAPFPSRIIAFTNSPVPYRDLYLVTLRLAGELSLNNMADIQHNCNEVVKLLERSRGIIRQTLDERLRAFDALWYMREMLEELSNYLEYLGIATFIVGVCNELTTPNKKKSKKKVTNKSPDEIKTLELLNILNQTLQDSIVDTEKTFKELPTLTNKSTFVEEFSRLNVNEQYISPVDTKLKNGYSEMVADVVNVLQKKLKYLQSLIH